VVAANAQATECLRLACDAVMPIAQFLQCSAQSASMMRQSQSALRMLLGLQAARQKIEADAAALERAAWTEHCAAGLMAQALTGAPLAAVELPPPPPPPAPAPEPQADECALIYPRRVALIRQLGRLPDNPSFGPPEDYLVRALVTGHDNEGAAPCEQVPLLGPSRLSAVLRVKLSARATSTDAPASSHPQIAETPVRHPPHRARAFPRQNIPNSPRRNPGVSAVSGLTDASGSSSGPRSV
jgi:hypothetical protein